MNIKKRKAMKKAAAKEEPQAPAADKAPVNPMAPAEDSDEAKRSKAKYDMEDLLRAEDIKKDPERMKHVKKHAEDHLTKVRSIADLKDLAEALPKKKQSGSYTGSY